MFERLKKEKEVKEFIKAAETKSHIEVEEIQNVREVKERKRS